MASAYFTATLEEVRDFLDHLGVQPVLAEGGLGLLAHDGQISINAFDNSMRNTPNIYLASYADGGAQATFAALRKQFGRPKKQVQEYFGLGGE